MDRYVHDDAGLLLARAYVKAGAVNELAELDFIARVDVLPRPALAFHSCLGLISRTFRGLTRRGTTP